VDFENWRPEDGARTVTVPTEWAKAVVRCTPVTQFLITDIEELIFRDGSNTYYIGGLGMFPKEYWKELGGFMTRQAAQKAHSTVVAKWVRNYKD
jgi:hypothetical protein